MRRTITWLLGLALMLVPLTALAHDFDGGGDCDGWTLELDGTFGAHTIYIDGQPHSPATTYFIADGSDASQRSFVVFWDKDRNDVTRTHDLERDTAGCTETTSTVATTTTTPEVTTTAPTTTVPVAPTTSDSLPPVVVDEPPTTERLVELPFTGMDPGLGVLAGLALLGLGGLLVRRSDG